MGARPPPPHRPLNLMTSTLAKRTSELTPEERVKVRRLFAIVTLAMFYVLLLFMGLILLPDPLRGLYQSKMLSPQSRAVGLPLLTRAALGFGDFLRGFWWLVPLPFIGAVALVIYGKLDRRLGLITALTAVLMVALLALALVALQLSL